MISNALFLDLHPGTETIQEMVTEGLSKVQKTLPPKLFYDERGSELFDQICELEEYYPTRTELAILRDNMPAILGALGQSVVLVEYGSGSSTKTQLLLENLKGLIAYVPIDISREHLAQSALQIERTFPNLNVLPVCADYSQNINLSEAIAPDSHAVAYFPGSSIGNFEREHAVSFLQRVHDTVGQGGGLLIGVDLVKDEAILERAYNDTSGTTARFNLNMLSHINHRLGSQIDILGFKHRAIYNMDMARIEMYLVANKRHSITIGDHTFRIQEGESILTEYSHKYTLPDFKELAKEARFAVEKVWVDSESLFSIQYLSAF